MTTRIVFDPLLDEVVLSIMQPDMHLTADLTLNEADRLLVCLAKAINAARAWRRADTLACADPTRNPRNVPPWIL